MLKNVYALAIFLMFLSNAVSAERGVRGSGDGIRAMLPKQVARVRVEPKTPMAKVIEEIKSSSGRNSAQKQKLIDFILIQKEVFKSDEMDCIPQGEHYTSVLNLTCSFEREIDQTDPQWKNKVDADALKVLREKKKLIADIFDEQGFGWAWVLRQLGEDGKSTTVLKEAFESEFKKTMEVTYASFTGSPMYRLDKINAALDFAGDTTSQEKRRQKIREAATHISQITSTLHGAT